MFKTTGAGAGAAAVVVVAVAVDAVIDGGPVTDSVVVVVAVMGAAGRGTEATAAFVPAAAPLGDDNDDVSMVEAMAAAVAAADDGNATQVVADDIVPVVVVLGANTVDAADGCGMMGAFGGCCRVASVATMDCSVPWVNFVSLVPRAFIVQAVVVVSAAGALLTTRVIGS